MNDMEAKNTLHDLQIWSRYKSVLMDRMATKILSKNSPKHRKPAGQHYSGSTLTRSRTMVDKLTVSQF